MTIKQILAAIPIEQRTEAVTNLATDAMKLGCPAWAAELVRLVAEWFRESRKWCRCGAALDTWICDQCPGCRGTGTTGSVAPR